MIVITDYIIYGRESSNEHFMINVMFDTLSEQNNRKAEKLLAVFVDAVYNNENN